MEDEFENVSSLKYKEEVVCMNAVMIRMIARQGKRTELLQAMTSLAAQMRLNGKCSELSFAQDLDDENRFLFLEHWQTRQEMEADVRTELFGVLLGGIHVLCYPPEVMVQTITASEGEELFEAIRQQKEKEVEPVERSV
jgi:quinol monooxygenase YgiN